MTDLTLGDLKVSYPRLGQSLQQLLDWTDEQGSVEDVFCYTFQITQKVVGLYDCLFCTCAVCANPSPARVGFLCFPAKLSGHTKVCIHVCCLFCDVPFWCTCARRHQLVSMTLCSPIKRADCRSPFLLPGAVW